MNVNRPNLRNVTGLTEAELDAAIAAHFAPSRQSAVQATVAASSAVKRPYVPAGCDQQSRVEDGARARCTNPAACTMPLCVCRPESADASNELCLEDDGEPWHAVPTRTAAAMFGWVFLCIAALAVIVGAW